MASLERKSEVSVLKLLLFGHHDRALVGTVASLIEGSGLSTKRVCSPHAWVGFPLNMQIRSTG